MRVARIVTMDEFRKRMNPIVNSPEFPYNLPKGVERDLKKVNFDFENWSVGNALMRDEDGSFGNYPVGYEVLSNGLSVLFVNAGGDWECPICFIIYWSGVQLRAYIPYHGNVYNKREKCAYGSEEDPDLDPEEEYPDGDPNLIRQDILGRITIV